MRSWLGAFTTRGTSFLAAGAAAALAGLFLSERDLVSVGILLLVLPLFSALAASRARYRLSCTRGITPARVTAGQTARVQLHLENVSRLPTGLLLAEDTVPYQLGTRPRYVLNGIERGGSRDLSYPVRSDLRGKFVIGPLQIRVADAFGLVELTRSFTSRTTLMVTPRVMPLPRAVFGGSWHGDGEGRARTAAAAGEDDVVPRTYRDGDELRRVHWRSTARYGELMVRREEQQWRNRVLLLVDTRRSAHAGTGTTSSFEFAISAAASVGLHLARDGVDGELITAAGSASPAGIFEDTLLNSLAVMTPSRSHQLDPGIAAMRSGGGLLVAILGRMSATSARQLAASRRDAGTSIALLLAVSTWTGSGRAASSRAAAADGAGNGSAGNGSGNGLTAAHQADVWPQARGTGTAQAGPGTATAQAGPATATAQAGPGTATAQAGPGTATAQAGPGTATAPTARHAAIAQARKATAVDIDETGQAAMILRAAGWRVAVLDAATPLAAAWQQLAMFPDVVSYPLAPGSRAAAQPGSAQPDSAQPSAAQPAAAQPGHFPGQGGVTG